MTKIQFATASLVLKIHFLGAFPPRIISILSPNIRRTTQFMTKAILLATLAKKNTLGEEDKINLRTCFAASQYDFHLWADDSKIGGNERHAVGVPHTWNS